jgi:rhodanese-related sulfurtransferase
MDPSTPHLEQENSLHMGTPQPISRDDLHRSLDNGDSVTMVEALGSAYFDDAHLPGAVNIPPDQVDRLAPALLQDPSARIVVYCSGTCHNSEIAAQRLIDLGYQDVHIYLGGKEDWVEHGLPIERSEPLD